MKTSEKPPVIREESLWWRGLWALPLFGIFLAARTILGASVSKWLPIVEEAARTGWVEDVSGSVPVKMRSVLGLLAALTMLLTSSAAFAGQFLGIDYGPFHEDGQAPHTPIPDSQYLSDLGVLSKKFTFIKTYGDDASVNINGSQAEVHGINASVRSGDFDVNLTLWIQLPQFHAKGFVLEERL